VVRNPASLPLEHANLEIVRGDILDLSSIAPYFAGMDAVISAIGANTLKPTTLYSAGMANVIKGMKVAGVKRVTGISAAPLEVGKEIPFFEKVLMRLVLRPLLRNSYADNRRMEDELEASQLDWTVIRAPRLTNGAHTGRYKIGLNKHLSALGLSRADVADYIVKYLGDRAAYRSRVELAY
jgi:putative NADH-flavin reductase